MSEASVQELAYVCPYCGCEITDEEFRNNPGEGKTMCSGWRDCTLNIEAEETLAQARAEAQP